MAGGYVLSLLSEKRAIFNGLLIASPTFTKEESIPINIFKKASERNRAKELYLYFSIASNEHWVKPEIDSAAKYLQTTKIKNLRWLNEEFATEDHWSTPHRTLYNGLTNFYYDYKPLTFKTLSEFEKFGGMKQLEKHYKKRAQRYSLSTEIDRETKHYLILRSLQEKNFNALDHFVNQFKSTLTTYPDEVWMNRILKFYIKHKRYKKAQELNEYGLKTYNNSDLLSERKRELMQHLQTIN